MDEWPWLSELKVLFLFVSMILLLHIGGGQLRDWVKGRNK